MIKAIIDRLLGRTAEASLSQKTSDRVIDDGVPNPTQVYEGKPVECPEFAVGLDGSKTISEIKKHVVCTYTPHVENQRIYHPAEKEPDGSMKIVFEGVSATCPALKQFGEEVARRRKMRRPFRYVDLNHVYGCCCGAPDDCVFHNMALNERQTMERQLR